MTQPSTDTTSIGTPTNSINNNENNCYHPNMGEPVVSNADYPTGTTVPFPNGNSPYPQQVALMECLLRGLDDSKSKQTRTITQQPLVSIPTTTTTTTTTKLLLLESPTGTGKSLSLACACIAWLKYQEHVDLTTTATSSTQLTTSPTTSGLYSSKTIHSSTTGPSSSSSSSSSPTGVDWVDNFTGPNNVMAWDQQQRRACQEMARRTRQELSSHLTRIQLQYQDDDDNHHDHHNHNHNEHHHHKPNATEKDTTTDRRRMRRENICQRAVLKCKLQQRKLQKTHKTPRTRLYRKKQPSQSKDPKTTNEEENCFMLSNHYEDESVDSDPDHFDSEQHPLDDPDFGRDPASDLLQATRLDGSAATLQSPRPCCGGGSSSPNTAPKITVGNVSMGTGVRKLIYAARTHSQLSQFISEVKRTVWGASLRVVHLGSRSHGLCGYLSTGNHHAVTSESTMTDQCLDFQKKKQNKRSHDGQSTTSCPFYNPAAIQTLALQVLSTPTDIEEVCRLGQASKTCAYYATRAAVAAAELVVVPYSLLVSKSSRQAVGLDLTNQLVVIDEAHNLPEVIRSLDSVTLTLPTLEAALDQLSKYVTKYVHRLCGKNLHALGQLRKVCQALIQFLKQQQQQQQQQTSSPSTVTQKASLLVSPSQFIMNIPLLDSINLFKLLRFMEHSRLSQKLLGFMQANTHDQTDQDATATSSTSGISRHVSPMSLVEGFLRKLTMSTEENGKIVTVIPKATEAFTTARAPPSLKYVLLNPAAACQDLWTQPYAVCLVGGTLSPFGFLTAELCENPNWIQEACRADQLLRQKQQQISGSYINHHLTAFTCTHVVPPSNVLLQSISAVDHIPLDFRHATRSTPKVCAALGKALVQLARRVPNGMVVFVPSYSYQESLIQFLRYHPDGFFQQLQELKHVFCEPKSSSQVESTLDAYGKAASGTNGGALLFSVVGGKLSEGINFANEMARGVVVVGLPYPDATDPILQEKMRLLNATANAGGVGLTGPAYYQNLCMRAVNQSVGRAIRHAQDYAAIVLLDSRYSSNVNIATALPSWLTSSTPEWRTQTNFSQVLQRLEQFFKQW